MLSNCNLEELQVQEEQAGLDEPHEGLEVHHHRDNAGDSDKHQDEHLVEVVRDLEVFDLPYQEQAGPHHEPFPHN